MRAHLALLVVLLLTAACAPSAGRGAPVPAAPPAAVAAPDSFSGPWRVRNAERPRGAVLELRAELRSSVDTLVRLDSVASRTWLEWSVVPGRQPQRLVGMVRDFAVQSAGDTTWRAVPDLAFPVTFAADVVTPGTQPRFETPDAAGCDARAAAVQALRDAWISPPPTLAIGAAWADTATYTLCRDGILLGVTGSRSYTVDGAEVRDGRLVLRVSRSSDTQIAGRGVQFGDSIRVTGRSMSQGLLLVTLDGGAIVSGRVRSELRLEMRGRRRTQQLVQSGVLDIRTP